MKRSAAPREEESAPIDKGCARSSIRAALHRETRRAVHRHHVRRPARHPILVAIESIHLIPPWLGESFQNLPLMPGFRQRPQLGFKATRMLIPLRTRRLFVQCLWCMQPSTRSTLATLTIKKFLSPAWRLELRCHIALNLCEFSSFVFAYKLEQIGPNSSEDEGRGGEGLSGRGGRVFSAVEVPDNGVEGREERLSGRGRGCSQRCRFQRTAWKGEGRGGGGCLRYRLPHCRGQWCSHLTVGGFHAEIPVAAPRRAFRPGRR